MKLKRIILLFGLMISIVIVSSCGNDNNEQTNQTEEKVPVRVINVEKGNIENTVRYLGDIKANNHVEVFATIPNKVTSIKARVNDYVEKGEILATVKNSQIKQNLKSAQSALNSARSKYENVFSEWERTKELYEQDAISQSQYESVKSQKESAKAGVEQAEANLENAKERLEDTRIDAPISGIISQRNFDIGDQPAQQRSFYKIVSIDKVKIMVNIAEKDIDKINKGDKSLIKVNAYPDQTFKGKVSRIYPTVNPQTRSTNTEIIIPNKDHKLKPGMYATVNIVVNSNNNTFVIPNHAIIEKTSREYLGGELSNSRINTERFVYTVQDGKAKRIKIKPGIITDNETEVLEGVSSKDKIVVRGEKNLSNGSSIEIVE